MIGPAAESAAREIPQTMTAGDGFLASATVRECHPKLVGRRSLCTVVVMTDSVSDAGADRLDLAAELKLQPNLSDSGFGVLVDAAHTGKNVRDTIVPDWTDSGEALSVPHPVTEWALWYLGNLYAAALLRAGELIGWPSLDTWQDEAVRLLEGMQELLNEVKWAYDAMTEG